MVVRGVYVHGTKVHLSLFTTVALAVLVTAGQYLDWGPPDECWTPLPHTAPNSVTLNSFLR